MTVRLLKNYKPRAHFNSYAGLWFCNWKGMEGSGVTVERAYNNCIGKVQDTAKEKKLRQDIINPHIDRYATNL
jgi:hypothetical protein